MPTTQLDLIDRLSTLATRPTAAATNPLAIGTTNTSPATLALGQRVHCILYGGRDGTIVAIHGTQSPATVREHGIMVSGGSATFDIVWDDDTESHRTPEAIIRCVQWRIYDDIVSAAEIAAAKSRAALHRIQAEAAKQQAAQRRQQERAALPAAHPTLEVGTDSHSGTLAARNIRRQLKAAFPTTKFSVRKTHHGSLTISWTDGPTSKQVNAITAPYQTGNFDGMEDIYKDDKNNVWPDVFGGARYIFNSRNHSDALIAQAIDSVWQRWVRDSDNLPKPTPADHTAGRTWNIRIPAYCNDEAATLINEALATL